MRIRSLYLYIWLLTICLHKVFLLFASHTHTLPLNPPEYEHNFIGPRDSLLCPRPFPRRTLLRVSLFGYWNLIYLPTLQGGGCSYNAICLGYPISNATRPSLPFLLYSNGFSSLDGVQLASRRFGSTFKQSFLSCCLFPILIRFPSVSLRWNPNLPNHLVSRAL